MHHEHVSAFVTSFDSLLAFSPLDARGIIGTLIIGFIIGAIAKFLTPWPSPHGCFVTILIGVGGSFLALFLGRLLGLYGEGDVPRFVGSLIGAVLLLVIYHAIFGTRGGPRV